MTEYVLLSTQIINQGREQTITRTRQYGILFLLFVLLLCPTILEVRITATQIMLTLATR
jgi:hypothetical protein